MGSDMAGLSFRGSFMIRLLLVLLTFPSTTATALDWDQFQLLEAEHVSIDWWKTDYKRDPYLPEYTGKWTEGAAFNLHLRFLEVFKWTNKLHMDATDTGLKHCGWEYELVMDRFARLQPFAYHHSQHSLDRRGTGFMSGGKNGFPVEDRYGIRFVFHTTSRSK